MNTINAYNIEVQPDTRNHKGSFVRDTTYKLIEIDRSGWALICQDDAICHYVDPSCLRELPTSLND